MYILLKIGNTCINKLFKEDYMRRENRRKNVTSKTSSTDSIILYAGIGVAILAVIVFALFMYSKNLSDDVKDSTMSLEKMANIANNTQNTESASTEIGKSVEEATNELNTINTTNDTNTKKQNNTTNTTNATKSNRTANQTKSNTRN